MKKIFSIILLLCALATNATTYNIANQTQFDAINNTTYYPGDILLFLRGQKFYGSLTINQSGTLNNRIIIGAYGTGADPIITGFTTVSAWTNLGSNIWESTNAVSTLSTANVVSINGVNTAMGRTPNSGSYYTFQSHSGSTSITSSNLTGAPNWTGAEAVMRIGHFKLDRRVITSQNASTINWSTNTSYEPTDGFGFFIQNDSRTLDVQNEWYYNPATKKIRIYSAVQPTNVKVASVDYLLTINASYLTIQNILFEGANHTAIYSASTTNRQHITIQNCSVNFTGIGAIRGIRCSNYLIDNNSINNSNTYGIGTTNYLTTYAIKISNNVIQNTAFVEGMAMDMWSAISAGKGVTVEYNRIVNTGFDGISFYGDSVIVRNNYIDTFCKWLDDGGGIYTFTGSSQSLIYQCKVYNNICINGLGNSSNTTGTFPTIAAGIYLDEKSNDIEVYNNTVYKTAKYGLFFNSCTNINAHHNTVFDTDYSVRSSMWNTSTGLTLINNKFVAKTGQYGTYFTSGANDLPTKITANNNYYARPVGDGDLFYVEQPSTSADRYQTLTEWKTFSSQDVNSAGSPIIVSSDDDLYFYYNDTKDAKTVNITQPGVDVAANIYQSPIVLQPYTSVIIIRDSSTGTYYYVSTSGNDSNNGLTEFTPIQSLSKVNSLTLNANDIVRFKSGDLWYGQLITKSGSASGTITYSSYGSGEKPLIHAYVLKNQPSDWTLISGNIWSTPVTGENSNIVFNNATAGHRKWSQGTLLTQGNWFYDSTSSVVKLYSTTNPSSFYSDIKVVMAVNLCSVADKSYVTLDRIGFKFGDYGIVGANSSHIEVKNCDVAWIGGSAAGAPTRKGNGIEFWANSSNVNVHDNNIWECYDAGLTNQSATASTVMSNIAFKNNKVWNCEYSYEYFNTGSGSSSTNIFIENNVFYNAGGGWGHSQRPDPSGYQLRLANRTEAVHTNFIIRNNILDTSTGELLHVWDTTYSYYKIDHNWYKQAAGNMVGINFTTYYTAAQIAAFKTVSGWEKYGKILSFSPTKIIAGKLFNNIIRVGANSKFYSANGKIITK